MNKHNLVPVTKPKGLDLKFSNLVPLDYKPKS